MDYTQDGKPFGFLHRTLIGQFGLSIGELWWLQDLADACAQDGRYEFLVTSAPLNMPNGIGSPASAGNPLALVRASAARLAVRPTKPASVGGCSAECDESTLARLR